MISHRTSKRVRYGETDQMGYLYYGNYSLYYEIGRVELLRSLGLTYRELERVHGVAMPVVNLQARYLRPALYDDEVSIQSEVRTLPARQLVFHHELYGPNGRLLNGARVTLCFVERRDGGGRVGCPAALLEVLAPHFA